ncbi:MAG: Minf_1886 family protein [Tepidisphaeraceae bacterium]|jgi:uncharacterized repeat protein (TIGR04138 family)
MPPPSEIEQFAALRLFAEGAGAYPIEAYEFVHRGLAFTVGKVHGSATPPARDRHVTGQQLCQGLREYALGLWGRMARTVLQHWNITGTIDFGRIVFELIEHKILAATEQDRIEDFRDVYDFKTALETEYRIASHK